MAGTKPNNTSWKPGQSGNPTGLSNVSRAQKKRVRDLARTYTEEAVLAAVKIMRGPESKPTEILSAVNIILDRGHGRPPVSVEIAGEDGRTPDSPLSYEDLDGLSEHQVAMLYKESIERNDEDLVTMPTDGVQPN